MHGKPLTLRAQWHSEGAPSPSRMAIYTAVAIIGVVGLLVLAMWRQPTCYTREYIDTHPDFMVGWSDAARAHVYDQRCPTTFSTMTSTLAVIPGVLLLYCVGHWLYYAGTWVEAKWRK